MMNPWLYVIFGGLFEMLWAATLKMSEGFTDILWTVITLILLTISMVLLNKGLAKGLSSGSAYTVWVGIGAVGSIFLGILIFSETMGLLKGLLLAMIIIGVIGVEREQSRSNSHQ